MEHKDVLADRSGLDTQRQSGEKELTPEIQIQRLTAIDCSLQSDCRLEEQLPPREFIKVEAAIALMRHNGALSRLQ